MYRITYGSRKGQNVSDDDIYLTFPNGDVVLEEDVEQYYVDHPELKEEDDE